ncbi:amidase [Mesorhizobium sp. B2-4-19]|uniref:amidase n=1 Tax=Mesorhizobium sp. B2-4-19 TaxID=2589930 RepID=UPI00112CACF2|nr:amidase [Mesorhizobium sp. B2-4-19]TPK59135.1 amidase [Mesorhizobium sp. B2-4-19]
MRYFETIAGALNRLSDKAVSSVELCKDLLIEIHRDNPTLGAYSDILEETALSEAAASDARRAEGRCRGPLDGIPVAVKDIIDTTPAVCKAGLDHLSAYRPASDATMVRLLRNAGAVILGVTETDPGAFSTETPQVINPLAQMRSAGGSSGGSGAAVAAGLAYAALGTDTGGSVRIPAACCSVYGFKPSWGRLDTTGVRPLAPSLDHVGVLACSVADLRIVQTVLDPTIDGMREQPSTFSLGISEAYFADANNIVKQAMVEVVCKLRRHSQARLYDVSLPAPDDVLAFHMINLPWEAAAYHAAQFPDEWPRYPDVARLTVEKGKSISAVEYESADRRRRDARAMVDAALVGIDALILPTLPIDAPLRSVDAIELAGKIVPKLEATIRYTSLFNQSGHPVISMPATLLPDGRALSIQLVGRRDGDAELLMLAHRIERLLAVEVDYAAIVAGQAAEVHNFRAAIV